MLDRAKIMSCPRLAGSVIRYHTWPMLRRETVAEHAWNVLRIYSTIFGYPEPQVTKYIIWHDCGEFATGDLPFPIKANNPELKESLDKLEEQQVAKMGVVLPVLEPTEKKRIKCADLLDMLEAGTVEVLMGNQFAETIVKDTREAVFSRVTEFSSVEQTRIAWYINNFKQLQVS